MLHVFSINLVKLVTRKSKMTFDKGQREYMLGKYFYYESSNTRVVFSFLSLLIHVSHNIFLKWEDCQKRKL